jgi:hypothetical protein
MNESIPNEARQRPVLDKYEHGRARWEEGFGSAISGRVDQGQGDHHRRRMDAKDDQVKRPEGWPMAEERKEQATAMPKGHLRHPYGQVQGRQGNLVSLS